MSVAAIVLAAGASSRLGQPKQLLLDTFGEILVHRVSRDAYEAGCRPVCVVVGAHAAGVRAA
ncbi:MAG: NTP transferase domain-containing protein, partial [Gemmatimonas sp.]